MSSYRITYSIERLRADGEYEEVGFGSSFSHSTLDAAAYDVESFIQNRQWETTEGMPDPLDSAYNAGYDEDREEGAP